MVAMARMPTVTVASCFGPATARLRATDMYPCFRVRVGGQRYALLMTIPELTSIDLFAGAGGLSQGLKSVGFSGLYANELVPRYAQTYKLNHPEVWVDSRDIRGVDAHAVREELGLKRGQLDLIAGGPPCQGFSINAPIRSGEDRRNHLFREYLRFVEEFEPRSVVIENVPGLVSFGGGSTLDAILQSLRALGYGADVQILYAPHHGVPQTRWRTVVIGIRGLSDDDVVFPEAIRYAPVRVNFTAQHGGKKLVKIPTSIELPAHVSVRDAIGDLPVLANGEACDEGGTYAMSPQNDFQRALRIGSAGVFNHVAPKLGAINMKRLSHIPTGGNWTNIPVALLPTGMKRARRSDHTKRYGRVEPEGLASTILTKCDPHWGAYFHYDQDRAFTVREAARIQSFPDFYRFAGSRVEQYEQVGNAVPPFLGAAIGQSIARSLGESARSFSVAV